VKVQLQFRGREMAHQELGMALMHRVKDDLITMAAVEMAPKQMGKSINMTLSPLPANKRKRKFEPHTDEELEALDNEPEEDDED
jgi:translation initiation factor IF-3